MLTTTTPANTAKEKACSICRVVKPIDSFRRNSRRKDGRNGTCTRCYLNWRRTRGVTYKRACKERWRRRNPEKARAHQRVCYAIAAGRLLRQPCETCGDTNTHAHHNDYSKPLDVRWFCPRHHRELHAREIGGDPQMPELDETIDEVPDEVPQEPTPETDAPSD